MRSRLELHEKLVTLLGSRYVYFQPPENLKLVYPCIVYERYDIQGIYADGDMYLEPRQYRVTIIDSNPDSELVSKMAKFPLARFSKHFVSDQLNHDIFIIYY